MKILLITYEFPPSGGVAVQRALSFAKYLPSNGFEVHVLTARNPASPVQDMALAKEIPADVSVHRAWTAEPSYSLRQKLWRLVSSSRPRIGSSSAQETAGRDNGDQRERRGGWKQYPSRVVKRLLCPDPHVLWLPSAFWSACRIIEKHDIDVVLTTVPPFSLLLLANWLARRYPHLKMVSDFRDEWRRFFLNDFEFLQGAHTRRRAAEIEREAVARSSLVVATTHSSLNEIRRSHLEQPDEKFACVPNGYDPDAFANFAPRSHGTDKVVVTYVGTVYKICSARYYLDALDELPETVRSRFETRFVGRVIDEEQKFLKGRKSSIRLLGFLPHTEVFRLLEEADYLLVTVTNGFASATLRKIFSVVGSK